MCGRVVVAMDSASLIALNKGRPIRNGIRYRQSYNTAPTNYLPVSKDGEIEMMYWGTKNKDNTSLINARSETMDMYFKANKKCFVIVQGYYEWKNGSIYYFKHKDNKYLFLAGIYKTETDQVEYLNTAWIRRKQSDNYYKVSNKPC